MVSSVAKPFRFVSVSLRFHTVDYVYNFYPLMPDLKGWTIINMPEFSEY